MSAAISFTPHHPQPFTLEQAMLLEIDTLVAGTANADIAPHYSISLSALVLGKS
jgi:hypothetical protein